MKRGELTTQQIVVLIILIASFIVVLFFLLSLDLGKQTKSQLCHNSVVLEGNTLTSATLSGLNCHTNYLCLTSDKNGCKNINPSEVKIVKTSDEVYKVLANNMQQCWWEFGEGETNYISSGLTKNNYCSICSQIKFDKSLRNIKENGKEVFTNGEINKNQLYNYMNTNNVTGKKITYIKYLFGTNTNLEKLEKEILDRTKTTNFGNIKIGTSSFVVMGIVNKVSKTGWVLGAGAVGAVAIGCIFTVGACAAVATIAGAVSGAGAGLLGALIYQSSVPEIGALFVKGRSGNLFMSPTIQEMNSNKFKELNCKNVVTLS